MPKIELLDQQTIDKIAAGEVIERPSSVVKELVENAIDAGSSAVTVEIKDGGISFIRITDNGCGMESDQVALAFLRHSTSKIRKVEDLLTVSSLGFRGEALSSIAAVSQVELITKTAQSLSGLRYVIEGGAEKLSEEIGAPEGTTFLVRNLFYNTPARKKFLKTAQTEAGYISSLLERLALSHPEISFKLIVNNQPKLHTSGNSNLKEAIYHIYGRDIASNLIEVQGEDERLSVRGYIGKPLISRGNRNFENYFINGRYVKSSLIAKSIEDAYQSFVMQHKYPFTALHISINGNLLDMNVHPTKMELRFSEGEAVYEFLEKLLRDAINQSELVYQVSLRESQGKKEGRKADGARLPEPFEKNRLEAVRRAVQKDSPYEPKYGGRPSPAGQASGGEQSRASGSTDPAQGIAQDGQDPSGSRDPAQVRAQDGQDLMRERTPGGWNPPQGGRDPMPGDGSGSTDPAQGDAAYFQQESLPGVALAREGADAAASPGVLREESDYAANEGAARKLLELSSRKDHKIIGQLFETYWLVEFDDRLYIIDQHAAHEKVLYERTLARMDERERASQAIYPPILLTLDMQEETLLKKYMSYFEKLGFEIEHFGGKEYAVNAVPANLFGIDGEALVIEVLDGLSAFHGKETPQIVLEKIASMSCKAAVKGNQALSRPEAEALIGELLTLENPYHCPHGRPTIISMSKHEIEKKFKRVL